MAYEPRPAGRPDQHVVALLHAAAVAGDELAVRGGVDEPGGRRLLPGQVLGLGHQLVGLDQGEFGESAVVGLEAPDPLGRVEHGVVVAVGGLQLHRQAVRDDAVAGPPVRDAGSGAQHDAGHVGADDVEGLVVTGREFAGAAVAAQEGERGQRFEDGAPHGVVVHRAGHHGDQHLAEARLGGGDVLEVDRLGGVLLRCGHPLEHVHLVVPDDGSPIALGERQVGHVRGGDFIGDEGAHYVVHSRFPIHRRGPEFQKSGDPGEP